MCCIFSSTAMAVNYCHSRPTTLCTCWLIWTTVIKQKCIIRAMFWTRSPALMSGFTRMNSWTEISKSNLYFFFPLRTSRKKGSAQLAVLCLSMTTGFCYRWSSNTLLNSLLLEIFTCMAPPPGNQGDDFAFSFYRKKNKSPRWWAINAKGHLLLIEKLTPHMCRCLAFLM